MPAAQNAARDFFARGKEAPRVSTPVHRWPVGLSYPTSNQGGMLQRGSFRPPRVTRPRELTSIVRNRMPKRERLTNSSDETDLSSLLSGDTVFSIPYFQRAYKWRPDRLNQLNQDLLRIVDTGDTHFLGAVIIHGRRSNPSDPDVYEVIDGQQRITTIYLYLCSIVRVLCEHEEYNEAAGLFLKYLAIARETPLISNVKLHSCKDDRAQLNLVINELLSDAKFAEKLAPFAFRQLPAAGSERGRLRNNYRAAVRFFSEQVKAEGIDRLRALFRALLESMSVVQIDVFDPTDGPKIFDSLNSHQEPMTTGDLVRNEIFSRLADKQPDRIEAIDQRSWQPFYGKFKDGDASLFDSYFFPFGLIQDANLRKSEVFAKLRATWHNTTDPEEIVRKLALYQDAFLDLARGTNTQGHSEAVARAFLLLHSANIPSSTYPFLMQLSKGIKDGSVAQKDGEEILLLIESFLVRRAICGHEPTGLHAVFKRLWADCNGLPTKELVELSIKKHKTVVWPDAASVMEAIRTRPLYGAGVTRHLLLEWNRHLGGDVPQLEMWIEHVLPENPAQGWGDTFKGVHEAVKDCLANLIPLTPWMNQELGNRAYEEKRPVYLQDSAFKAARKFAEDHSEWTPAELEARGKMLAEWAVQRWPS